MPSAPPTAMPATPSAPRIDPGAGGGIAQRGTSDGGEDGGEAAMMVPVPSIGDLDLDVAVFVRDEYGARPTLICRGSAP